MGIIPATLDPALLADGPAALAESLRNAIAGPDAHPTDAAHVLAHVDALQLPPTTRAAMSAAMTNLQALLEASAALEAAGMELARELEAEPPLGTSPGAPCPLP